MSKFEISKSIFMHGICHLQKFLDLDTRGSMLFIIEMGKEITYTIMFVLISLLLAG